LVADRGPRHYIARARDQFGSTNSPAWQQIEGVLNVDGHGGLVPLAELLDAVDVPIERYDRRVVETALVSFGAMRASWSGRVVLGPYKRRRDVVLLHYDVIVPSGALEAARELVSVRMRQ